VQEIIRYLPFRFLTSFPIEIVNRYTTVDLASFITMFAYAIGLNSLANYLKKRGLRQYESFGN
jgi:ABC-type uncharacterized transport system permease subunit